jgi:hypothetical protein
MHTSISLVALLGTSAPPAGPTGSRVIAGAGIVTASRQTAAGGASPGCPAPRKSSTSTVLLNAAEESADAAGGLLGHLDDCVPTFPPRSGSARGAALEPDRFSVRHHVTGYGNATVRPLASRTRTPPSPVSPACLDAAECPGGVCPARRLPSRPHRRRARAGPHERLFTPGDSPGTTRRTASHLRQSASSGGIRCRVPGPQHRPTWQRRPPPASASDSSQPSSRGIPRWSR